MRFSIVLLTAVLSAGAATLSHGQDPALRDQMVVEMLQKLDRFDLREASPAVREAVGRYLAKNLGSPEYFRFVERYDVRDQRQALEKLALDKAGDITGTTALKTLIKWGDLSAVEGALDEGHRALFASLGSTGAKPAVDLLSKLAVAPDRTTGVRTAAIEALGKSRGGEKALLALATEGKISADGKAVAGKILLASSDGGIRDAAGKALAMTGASAGPKLPPIAELCQKTGDMESGKGVYQTFCFTCHQIGSLGMNFGPALSEIGSKLPKEALYTAILEPSQAISFGFEGWEVQLKDGSTLVGLITSETDAEVTLRAVGGIDNKLKKNSLKSRQKLPTSLMPPLAPALTEKQLVDLVEFLSAQKKK